MNQTQLALWNQLEAFNIGTGSEPFSFTKRLAAENGWSVAYADRVLQEYRKFLFLCMESGHVCTPSVQVDEAWHLHLTYTRSYWDDLCANVLPRPLHHDPTTGGNQQASYFRERYLQTLETYESYFGAPAPRDIWPSVDERFSPAAEAKKVFPSEYWLIPKAAFRKRFSLVAMALFASLGIVGCGTAVAAIGPSNTLILFGALILILIVMLVVYIRRNRDRYGDSSSDSTSFHDSSTPFFWSGFHGGSYDSNNSSSDSSSSGGDSSGSDGGGGGSSDGGGGGCGGGGCGGGGCGGG